MTPAWLRVCLALLAALLLVGTFGTEIADTDFWWHLKTGQYVVEQRALPVPDPFSYTSAHGEPAYPGEERVRYFNLTHEWLAQAVWYLLYQLSDFPGLVLWKAVLLAWVCGAAGYLAAERSGNFLVGVGAALAGVPVLRLFAADRPALVTFAFVALYVVILERFAAGGRARWLVLLVPLQWIWANSHGGFFLGWVVLGAYVVGCRRLPADRRKRLWIAAGSAVAVCGLNPNGFRIFEVLLFYRQSYLTETLIEWKRPFLWGPPYTFNVLLYSSAVALLFCWRKVRLRDALLFVAFGAASLAAFRNIPLVAFLAPVMLASYAWPPLAARLPKVSPRVAAALAAGILVTLIAREAAAGRLYQMRVAEWRFPRGAAEFLTSNGVEARLFNSYEYGGYLIWELWPQQQTFIDGRALNESVYRDYQKIIYSSGASAVESQQARNRLLAEYGVGIVVMNAFEYVTGVIYPVVLAMADPANSEWQLVFEDAQAVVFARDTPQNRELIERRRLDKSRVASHLEKACRTYIEHDPELPNCARSLGFLFLQAGDPGRAREALSLYLSKIDYSDPEAEAAYRGTGAAPR